jgi:hypothetical protein
VRRARFIPGPVHIVWAVVFAVWAALQWNDPDPLRWIAVYGGAAVVCALWATRRTLPVVAGALALLCLGWAALLMPQAVVSGELWASEVSRETGGLLVTAGWMIALVWDVRLRV